MVTQTGLMLSVHGQLGPKDSTRLPVHGIIPGRTLEWVAMFFSGDLPDSGVGPTSSAAPVSAGKFLTPDPPGRFLTPEPPGNPTEEDAPDKCKPKESHVSNFNST